MPSVNETAAAATVHRPLHAELARNLADVREGLGGSQDVIVRELTLPGRWETALLYIDGLVNAQLLHDAVIESLLREQPFPDRPERAERSNAEEAEPAHPSSELPGAKRTNAEHTNAERPDVRFPHAKRPKALLPPADRPVEEERADGGRPSAGSRLRTLVKMRLVAGDVSLVDDFDLLLNLVLGGDVLLLADGCREAVRIGLSGAEDRNVTEPISQSVTRGPMEAFTENLRTNSALIRRKIKDTRLRVESLPIGRVTKTNVSIVYLESIARRSIVEEVKSRLGRIDIDGVLESGIIEELIEDKTYTPFPTVFNSERPDTIAAGILEGRVAILTDGTPFVLLVPALFTHFFQAAEDYAQRFDISTLVRFIRYISFAITMLAPAFYIAISTFHQEMLPTSLLINLASQREGVPFPAFIEALLMEITYEILREAGVRMPRTVGQAVSIVGTLVIGQAAVQAGIVSAAMVIIVSITAIASYVIPSGSMSISARMLRFLFMMLAAVFGLFGVLFGLISLALHLATLRSFGVAYMTPWAPFVAEEQKDTLFRFPVRRLKKRPALSAPGNRTRQREPDRP